MDAAEVVPREVERDGGPMILDLLREAVVGEPRQAPHLHARGEVEPLDVGGADFLLFRAPADDRLLRAYNPAREVAVGSSP
jgi:hypothetical protein